MSSPAKVHIVGIGGAGMSAIAIVLRQQGREVSGSDLKASLAYERLRSHGVTLYLGHDPKNLEGADLVAISSAIPSTNPEVRWAIEHGIQVLTRSELLPRMISGKTVLGVAGTHGKTTTTSMLALSLMRAGRRPSFIVGGELNEIGTNALWDEGDELVIEADESDGTFLHLGCEGVIVTNIEPDHLDFYGTFDALTSAFARFVTEATGTKIICIDSPNARPLLDIAGSVSYGLSDDADYRIELVESTRNRNAFRLVHESFGSMEYSLAVPGRHNVLNAASVIAMTNEMGVDRVAVADALASFTGVARRFQYRGQYLGATLVDDYAHLPGEVEVVLEAAESQGYDRIIAVFQPHRYSRTQALFREFASSLAKADVIVVTDVYPAGEMPIPGVTGELISSLVSAEMPNKPVYYVPHRNKLAEFVESLLQDGDLCLTLGAGDLTMLFGEITEAVTDP